MWKSLFLILSAACGVAVADLPSTSQPFKSGVGFHTYRIPAMAVTNQGTIIVAADGRANAADIPTPIDMIVRRSTDNGNTWGPNITAANYGTNGSDTDTYPILGAGTYPRTSASDPALLVDRTNGRIWIFYDNGSSASYNGYGRTIKMELRYSDDDGLTWSSRYDLESVNPTIRPTPAETYTFNGSTYTYGKGEYIVGPGSGIQIENGANAGRLIFPVYWFRTNNCSGLIYSDDHGATWQRGGICGYGTGEVQIAELTNGDLMASLRPSGAAGGYRWFSKSSDGGATWGAMFRFNSTNAVPDPGCQGNIFRLSTTTDSSIGHRIASDKNRLIHSNAASTGGRDHMTVRVSYDEGASWPVSRLVYTPSAAYSSLAQLANGDIGLLFEKDNYGAIDFVRITIPEATNGTDAQPGYNLWANATFTLAQLMDPSISGKSADPDGNTLTNEQDYLNALANRPSASITATDAQAFEAGPDTTLEFTVTLSNPAATDIAVNLAFSGVATPGIDYVMPPATLTVPAGQTQATLVITALDDAVQDGPESVIATITPGNDGFPAYTVASPSSANAIIDDLMLPGTIVIATDADASETGDTGTFTITRDDTTAAATVAYTVSGTATPGSDYSALSGTVSFTAGQASATVIVTPIDDNLFERVPETVVLTLSSGAGYSLGYPIAATITIASDEATPLKANNNDALNLASSWLGDMPLSTEKPTWDNNLSGTVTSSLGANTTWAGITDSYTNGIAKITGAYTLAAGEVTVDTGANLALTNSGALSLTKLSGSGALAIDKTGNQDMSSSLNTAGAFNFNGTLQLRGDSTWMVLGNSATTQTAGTKFHLDTGVSGSNKRDFILGNAWDGRALNLASLSGFGNIRCDWGSTNVTRPLVVAQDIDTTFNGAINGHSANTRTIALTKSGSGSLTLAGVVGNLATVTQSGGTLVLPAANTYTGVTTVTGGTLVVTGSLPATATTVSGGTLAGTGTVKGATTVSGTLAPGIAGIGTLSVTNTLALSGTAAMQLHKAGAALTADKAQGITNLTYGGTLAVTATGDPLAFGDSFTLFSATTYAGSFATLNLPTLPTGLSWDTSTLATNGSISVKSEQSITFGPLPAKMTDAADFSPGATASSGLTVTYASSTPAVATIVGGQIHIVGVGTTTITASQPGNATYAPAADVTQILTVKAATTTATWTNLAGGAWETPNNWLADSVASGNTRIADFSTLDLAADTTVTLDTTPFTVAGLVFGDSTPDSNWILSGSQSLTLAITAGSPEIMVANQSATIATVLNGSAGLIKTGPGNLNLSAANTYTGSTTINAGVLDLGTIGKLYSSAYNNTDIVTVRTGATLRMASLAYGAPGSLGMLSDYRQRRVLDGGTFEITGASHSPGQNFTVTSTGGTLRYTATGETLALSGNPNSDIQLDGTVTFDALGAITVSELMAGPGGIIKTGGGTLLLNNVANPFSGNISVVVGQVRTGTSQGGGTNSYLGVVNGSRNVTIQPGASLLMQGNNTFGGGGKTAASIPTIAVNGGTLDALRFNILGNLSLNGATLAQSSTDSGAYQGWQFIGNLSVGGSAASTISSGNGKANHLRGAATTVFTVADATGSDAADLIITNALRDGSNDYPGAGSLLKNGLGTLRLGGNNSYSGTTSVTAGTLQVTGATAAGATTIALDATLAGTGTLAGPVTVDGNLEPGVIGVGTLTINNSLAITGSTTLEIHKDGTTLTADLLDGMTALTLDGDLTIVASGDPLVAGDTFVLFTMASGSATGSFTTLDLPPLPGSLEWDTSLLISNGSITVVNPLTPLQTWRELHFETSVNFGDAADNADPDHDGLANLIEYARDLDPNESGTTAATLIADTTTGHLRLSVVKNPAATDITYQVQVSSDLADWRNVEGTDIVTEEATASSLIVRDNTPITAEPHRSIRLKVTSPAQP